MPFLMRIKLNNQHMNILIVFSGILVLLLFLHLVTFQNVETNCLATTMGGNLMTKRQAFSFSKTLGSLEQVSKN